MVGDDRMKLASAVSETDFLSTVVEYAQIRGWLVYHHIPGMNRRGRWGSHVQGHRGFPDLVLARDGVVVFAELKTEKGRLSTVQEAWLEELTQPASLWRHVFCWRPSDWPRIEEVLR